jgi:hypothetical protein
LDILFVSGIAIQVAVALWGEFATKQKLQTEHGLDKVEAEIAIQNAITSATTHDEGLMGSNYSSGAESAFKVTVRNSTGQGVDVTVAADNPREAMELALTEAGQSLSGTDHEAVDVKRARGSLSRLGRGLIGSQIGGALGGVTGALIGIIVGAPRLRLLGSIVGAVGGFRRGSDRFEEDNMNYAEHDECVDAKVKSGMSQANAQKACSESSKGDKDSKSDNSGPPDRSITRVLHLSEGATNQQVVAAIGRLGSPKFSEADFEDLHHQVRVSHYKELTKDLMVAGTSEELAIKLVNYEERLDEEMAMSLLGEWVTLTNKAKEAGLFTAELTTRTPGNTTFMEAVEKYASTHLDMERADVIKAVAKSDPDLYHEYSEAVTTG